MTKLIDLSIKNFIEELASKSPAPGGGSVAALSGTLSTALTSMVCHLTIGKDKYQHFEDEIKTVLNQTQQLQQRLLQLIDEDTTAFNDVMQAFKLPKETDEQKQKRSNSIQKGYKKAAQVPLETARTCAKILDLGLVIAEKGNKNSITDAAVSALMAQAGVESAILNVKINLGAIKDTTFTSDISSQLTALQKDAKTKKDTILHIVEQSL